MLVIFSSRELASIFWVIIASIFFIRSKEVRKSALNVIKIFFDKKIVILWGIYIIYIIVITLLFKLTSFWNNIFIKDIIFFVIFCGLPIHMNSVRNESDELYLKRVIKNNFNLLIFFEFIVNTFTFHIIAELIIVPIMTIINVLIVYLEYNINGQNSQDEEKVHQVLECLNTIIILFLIFKTIVNIIKEYKNIDLVNNFISFILPIIYLIVSIPLVYSMQLYSKYEMLFLKFSYRRGINKKDNKKYFYRVIKITKFSIKRILIFENEYLIKIYPETFDDEFDDLLKDFKNAIENK